MSVMTSGCTSSDPARQTRPEASYYLALGDSLSRGVQPDSAGASLATRQGYADQLYAALRRGHPGLRLVKLGCSGETTDTMIDGGICSYPGGSQLAAAVSFLRAHRGRVSLITIDIGAHDPGSCVMRTSVGAVASFLGKSFPATVANLTQIMRRIRAAGGGHVPIICTYHFLSALAQWRNGLVGEGLARPSEGLGVSCNEQLATAHHAFPAPV